MDHGAGTHGTGLNCDEHLALWQAMITCFAGGMPQRNNLRMRGGIIVPQVPIAAAADDPVATDHHRTYRHFAGSNGAVRFAQGFFHPQLFGTHIIPAAENMTGFEPSWGNLLVNGKPAVH